MTDPVFLWRMEVRVPAAGRDAAEAVLESRCMAVSSFEADPDGSLWSVEGFAGAEPDRAAVAREMAAALAAAGIDPAPTVRFDLVPPRDWLADNIKAFPPLHIGRYYIHGSQAEAAPPPGSVPIRLDPGTAFGSGEHASTAGCLAILDELARRRRFRRVLDMGCGSGILAIAAAKTWRATVVASDIDPESARVAAINARRNRVGGLVRAVCGPGYASRPVAAAQPYDLICANILARPLIKMAGDLARHLNPKAQGGGVAVLSGLVARDGNRVAAAHRAHGLIELKRVVRDGWVTLLMGR